MQKTTWIYTTIALLAVVAGGAYFYSREVTSVQITEPSLPVQPSSASAPPSRDEEEIKRKTLEGIGSVKQLKPVPIAPTPSR